MSRVITFSRVFPAYHPRKGEPTYFVEKIWKSLSDQGLTMPTELEKAYNEAFPCQFTEQEHIHYHKPKGHTIRSGNRWKAGDKFSPRVWSGKPYASKMITIAPDIEIKKVWNITINLISRPYFTVNGVGLKTEQVYELAVNDGLSLEELKAWFKGGYMVGQIICWDESIEY